MNFQGNAWLCFFVINRLQHVHLYDITNIFSSTYFLQLVSRNDGLGWQGCEVTEYHSLMTILLNN
jgi:hypothetical protein